MGILGKPLKYDNLSVKSLKSPEVLWTAFTEYEVSTEQWLAIEKPPRLSYWLQLPKISLQFSWLRLNKRRIAGTGNHASWHFLTEIGWKHFAWAWDLWVKHVLLSKPRGNVVL